MNILPGICIFSLTAALAAGQGLQNRMDIPMGVPDLDDRFSNGLASYVGVPSLPGGGIDGPEYGAQPQGRSGVGAAASGNAIGNLYNQYTLPRLQPNTAGMAKWYGPEFAPPMGFRGPPMLPPGGPPPQQQQRNDAPKPNDGCKSSKNQNSEEINQAGKQTEA